MLEARTRGARHPGPARHRRGPTESGPAPKAIAGEICDQHGAALFSVAVALVGNHQQAKAAVIDVICTASRSLPPGQGAANGLRGDLTRRLYQRCGGAAALEAAVPCERPRIAVTLVHEGGLTYRAVAELLALSTTEVVGLLDAGLRGQVPPSR